MADRDLKDVFKEAADIAKVVPESMQEAAFNRALDLLQGKGKTQRKPDSKAAGSGKGRTEREEGETHTGESLADRINRTEHPEITDGLPILDRSLMVLRIAKDLGVDGVGAPEIANLLTDTFRIRTRRQNVNTALDDATQLVDRRKVGRGVTYKIMSRGEKFLDKGGSKKSGTPSEAKASDSRATAKRKRTTKASEKTTSKAKARNKAQAKKGSGSRRPGPKAAIEGLIEADYLKESRTISAIETRLKTKLGHTYKTTDLSPALGRLLRQGKLDRERNAEGQFEYTAK